MTRAAEHIKESHVLAGYIWSGFFWRESRWQVMSFLYAALKSYCIIKRTDVNLLWYKAPNAAPYWALIIIQSPTRSEIISTSNKYIFPIKKKQSSLSLELSVSDPSSEEPSLHLWWPSPCTFACCSKIRNICGLSVPSSWHKAPKILLFPWLTRISLSLFITNLLIIPGNPGWGLLTRNTKWLNNGDLSLQIPTTREVR